MSRFDYVAYDKKAQIQQAMFKEWVKLIEGGITGMGGSPRAMEYALKALEECYMWCGKLIRDEQFVRNESTHPIRDESTTPQEERSNG